MRLTPRDLDVQCLQRDVRHPTATGIVQPGIGTAKRFNVRGDDAQLIVWRREDVGEAATGQGSGNLRGNAGAATDRSDAKTT